MGEDVLRQQADVLSEHGHHALEDETAGADAVLAARDQRVEGAGEQEIERGVAFGQVGQCDLVHRLIELGVEIVKAGGRERSGLRSFRRP